MLMENVLSIINPDFAGRAGCVGRVGRESCLLLNSASKKCYGAVLRLRCG